MKIETDQVEIVSGVRHGQTLGSPIGLLLRNKDFANWAEEMSVEDVADAVKSRRLVEVPRPGHADLAGRYKYGFTDMRNVLERASARETAMRVALGSVARRLLNHFGVRLFAHVGRIGMINIADVTLERAFREAARDAGSDLVEDIFPQMTGTIDGSPVRCLDGEAEKEMMALIDEAKNVSDTLGGAFEVVCGSVPVGLGSHTHWDRKLDGRLGQAIMSIHAVKGVAIGPAYRNAMSFGSDVHDPIEREEDAESTFPYSRPTNHAGGLEGGITNGSLLVVRGVMKPIATLLNPLPSVNLESGEVARAHVERSDVCAVPACAVVAEAMVALVLADAFLDKFGGDSIDEIARNYEGAAVRCRVDLS